MQFFIENLGLWQEIEGTKQAYRGNKRLLGWRIRPERRRRRRRCRKRILFVLHYRNKRINGWNYWRMAESSAHSQFSGSLKFLQRNKFQSGGKSEITSSFCSDILKSHRNRELKGVQDTNGSAQNFIVLPLPKDNFVRGRKECSI